MTPTAPTPTPVPDADPLALRVLAGGPGLAVEDGAAALAWWQAERQAGEELVPFLIRQGVFVRSASRELDYVRKGYVSLGDVAHFFTSDAAARLLPHRPAPEPPPPPAAPAPAPPARGPVTPPPPAPTFLGRPRPITPATEMEEVRNFGRQTPTVPVELRRPVASEPPRQPQAPRPGSAGDSLTGRPLGEYRLLRRIGRGPHGSVFEARDPDDRPVAVKVLHTELANRGPSWVQRFAYEASLASQLYHPNVLPTLTVGQDQGLVYLATPLVASGSAQDLLASRGPFPAAEAARICRVATRGVAAAHDLAIFHGNLKPANLLLGDADAVLVSDFAMRATVEPGDGNPGGERDDVRQIGETFAALLTGRPVTADEAARAARSQGSSPLHPACAALIARALSREPAGGYRHAKELLAAFEDLEAALAAPTLKSSASAARVATSSWTSSQVSLAPPSAQPATPSPKPLEIGQVVGKCLLTERVGQGASGIVFRALHQSLNIPVAVKVLHAAALQTGDGQLYRQLRSEARLLAQLNHPHVVRVWDFEDSVELPYLILEYVEGLSLAELVEQSGRLRADRAVRVVAQVADGLAAACKLGIVHRDVKPANILLTRDGQAKLADLGLAVFAGDGNGNHHSGAGLPADQMAGTVAYMSPEQAVKASSVDHRSDIYSLGATFYHILTGRMPFIGRSRMEVILKHARDLPPPPHEVAPDLDPALSALVLRMLAKEPKDRFGSYEELLSALAALEQTPASPRPAPAPTSAPPAALPAGAESSSGTGRSLWKSIFRLNRPKDGGGA